MHGTLFSVYYTYIFLLHYKAQPLVLWHSLQQQQQKDDKDQNKMDNEKRADMFHWSQPRTPGTGPYGRQQCPAVTWFVSRRDHALFILFQSFLHLLYHIREFLTQINVLSGVSGNVVKRKWYDLVGARGRWIASHFWRFEPSGVGNVHN